jgi:hypothetical protein
MKGLIVIILPNSPQNTKQSRITTSADKTNYGNPHAYKRCPFLKKDRIQF